MGKIKRLIIAGTALVLLAGCTSKKVAINKPAEKRPQVLGVYLKPRPNNRWTGITGMGNGQYRVVSCIPYEGINGLAQTIAQNEALSYLGSERKLINEECSPDTKNNSVLSECRYTNTGILPGRKRLLNIKGERFYCGEFSN